MQETKQVDKIQLSDEFIRCKNSDLEKKELNNIIDKALDSFEDLYVDLYNCWHDEIMLSVEGGKFSIYPRLNLILDVGETRSINLDKEIDFQEISESVEFSKLELSAEFLSLEEAREIFFEYPSENRTNSYRNILCVDGNIIGYTTRSEEFKKIFDTLSGEHVRDSFGAQKSMLWFLSQTTAPSSVRVPLCYHLSDEKIFSFFASHYELCPLTVKNNLLMKNLVSLLKKGYIVFDNEKLILTEKGQEAVQNGNCKKIGKINVNKKEKMDCDIQITTQLSELDSEKKKLLFESYLKCDTLRANMGEYDLKRMEDPNMGHWELWEGNEHPDLVSLVEGDKVVARNPNSDIQADSIIGIDFGTKSTVVVVQDKTGKIKPMPVGNGNIRKELISDDFENPTVMQFIDLNHFLKLYHEREGRPFTLWKDLIVSHAANESMKETGIRSDEFYSYLYDLKQWAGEGNKKIIMRDKTGNDRVLDSYDNIMQFEGEDQMDPIEIYAYFIGLYVNNMNNGIYLEYLLSFPVTYEKRIREAILKSFERGLKKSIPQSLQGDEEFKKKFQVRAGASEPAAYAICALEKYGFEPDQDEEIFYGIFDFGGGTADFDFGLWKAHEDENSYDYCIEHFGSEGDRYLGGENLLQLISFEVFRQNIEQCRKENITFDKPLELIDIPVELKGYVNDSQEAKMNLKLMMEKLRPFWERSEDENEPFNVDEYSEFQVSLFDTDGGYKPNLSFEVDTRALEKILNERIEKGVRQFFNALKGTFGTKHFSKTHKVDKIHIFLAGNSSKSPILQKIFEKKIEEWSKGIKSGKNSRKADEYYCLYPPLGSSQAKIIQAEKNVLTEDSLEEPTGKTGVAWGLIEGRKGGRIEIKEEIAVDTEAKFAYYLGISVRKKFRVKISRDDEYGVWMKFIPAL